MKTTTIILFAVILVAIIVLGAVLIVLRRKFGPGAEAPPLTRFPIERLEQMREKGQISESEFKSLRKIALGLSDDDNDSRNDCSSNTPTDDDEGVSAV